MQDGTKQNVLLRLRAATQVAHRELERDADVAAQFTSRARYTQFLQRMYVLYVPLEQQIACWSESLRSLGINWDARRKSEWLRDDLLYLDALPNIDKHLPAPMVDLQSCAATLGALYVTEGATHGGQVMSALAQRQLHLTAGRGATFFKGYGRATRTMWNQFVQALTHASLSEAEQACAVDTACALFASFNAHLCSEDAVHA